MFFALETAFYQFGSTKHHHSYPQARPTMVNTYLPNEMESNLLYRFGSKRPIEDAWISPDSEDKPSPVSQVVIELENASKSGYKRGGYFCYMPGMKKGDWSIKPDYIAREMNNSKIFDFHVATSYVMQAQRQIRI